MQNLNSIKKFRGERGGGGGDIDNIDNTIEYNRQGEWEEAMGVGLFLSRRMLEPVKYRPTVPTNYTIVSPYTRP